MSTLLSSTTPVARKQHRCDCCGLVIPIGKRYKKWSVAAEGTITTAKVHRVCAAISAAYYNFTDTDPEERYVTDEPLQEFLGWFGEVDARAKLLHMAAAEGWSDDELDLAFELTFTPRGEG